MSESSSDDYGLSPKERLVSRDAPAFSYLPPRPRSYRPSIALIGAGGISQHHLRAYRNMGLEVVTICDLDRQRAEHRRDTFFPQATITTNFEEAVNDPRVGVVDVATHPHERSPIIEAALRGRKHVLSQKPFVLDLDEGQQLVQLADQQGCRLAVNQNGRWAPHFRYIHETIHSGLLGPLSSIDFVLHWDHTWTESTPFNEIHHLLLFDFAIHWFDIATCWLGEAQAKTVYASIQRASFQSAKPPFLGQVAIDYPHVQVRLALNAHVTHGQRDQTTVCGQHGTIRAEGPGLNEQVVRLWTQDGTASPQLEGSWFDAGFEGTMGELLCAIEEDREPSHSARANLRSLALCFAALESANTHLPTTPGQIRRCPN